MIKETIGIDLDNVITDSVSLFLKAIEEKHGIKADEKDIKRYNIAEQIGIDWYDFREVIDDPCLLKKVELYPGAREGINWLYDRFYSIDIVTARPANFFELTKDWLTSNDIHFNWLAHTNFKYEYAKSQSVKYFIEDRYRTAVQLAGYCDLVLLYDAPWNAGREIPENMIRVKNWGEIVKEFEKVV